MVKWSMFILVLFSCHLGFSQEEEGATPSPDIPAEMNVVKHSQIRIYTTVDGSEAAFVTGPLGLKSYTLDYLKLPEMVLSGGVEGTVKMRFVVELDGSLTDVAVMGGIEFCPECGEVATKFVTAMPKWKPATMADGTIVRSYVHLPVDFKIPLYSVTSNPELDPVFPGGHSEFVKFFNSNFKVPTSAQFSYFYKFVAQFKVDVDGTLKDLKIIRGDKNAPEINEEVLRVLFLMPKWIPGSILGENKEMLVNLPIKVEF